MFYKKVFIFFILFFLIPSIFSINETKKYIVVFEENEFKLNENSNLLSHSIENTLNLNSKILEVKSKIKNVESIKKIDKLFPGATLEINSDKELEELKKNPSIKQIIPDEELELLVSNTTHTLIESSQVWKQLLNGTNITGKGVKVAVFDGGIDTTHKDFGTCENFNMTKKNYTGFSLDYPYETDHPYPHNNYTRFSINLSSYNANNFTIRFDRIVLDSSDYLRIYDKSNSLLKSYNGHFNKEDYFVNDNYVELEFTSSSSTNDYGYKINNVIINSSFHGYINDTNCSNIIYQYDYAYSDPIPEDPYGHGVHVASLIASKNPESINYKGIAPGASLGIFKVCDNGGTCLSSDIITALNDVIDPNNDGNYSDRYDIVSMSIGFKNASPDYFLSKVFDTVASQGVLPVIAAGNDGKFYGDFSVTSPSTSRSVISVGASYKDNDLYEIQLGEPDQVVLFSSMGPTTIGTIKPDVIAPGVYICGARGWDFTYPTYTSCGDADHVEVSGTSMATPVTSGALALIKQKHPNWSVKELKATIKATALETNESYILRGWGRIQPLKAINLDKPSCVVEFNTSYYSYSISNQTTYLNLSYETYCRNEYNRSELWFIPIDNFDDLSNYYDTNKQTLIINTSKNGTQTMQVPRNTFTKGFFKFKTIDSNSSYNNYDLLYVENSFSDFVTKNITLFGPNSSNQTTPSNNFNLNFSIEKNGDLNDNSTIEVIKFFNPTINLNNSLNPFSGLNSTIYSNITSSNLNISINNIPLNSTGNYCLHIKLNSNLDKFIQNDSYICRTISKVINTTTETKISNITFESSFNLNSNETKTEKINNLKIVNTKENSFDFNFTIQNLNNFSINNNLTIYENYMGKVKVNKTKSFIQKYNLNLNITNTTTIKGTTFTYKNETINIFSTFVNKNISIKKQNVIKINESIFEIYKKNKLITFIEFENKNQNKINNIINQKDNLTYNKKFNLTKQGIYTYVFSNIENYTLNEFKVNRVIICKYNNTFNDLNHNAIEDSCENDLDYDNINDSVEKSTNGYVIGNEKFLNYKNLSMRINNSKNTNLNLNFNNKINVTILENKTNKTQIKFEFDFNLYSLDLTNIQIKKNKTENRSSIIIKNLNLFNQTKTVYLNNSINSTSVCIKDQEINSSEEISSGCNQTNEYIITCNNTTQAGYTCAKNIFNYIISGLKHSGIIEYVEPVEEESEDTPDSGSGSGSGGGGGGSSGSTVYIPTTQTNNLTKSNSSKSIQDENITEETNSIEENITQNSNESGITTITNPKIQINGTNKESEELNITKENNLTRNIFISLITIILFILIIVSVTKISKKNKINVVLSDKEKEILNYIINTRKRGYSIEVIKNECLKHGWPEETLDKIIKTINK